MQKDLGDKRAPWMTTIQEYDLEIKPSSVVRGHNLCKLVVVLAHFPIDNTNNNIDESFLQKEIYFIPHLQDSWYYGMRVLLEI